MNQPLADLSDDIRREAEELFANRPGPSDFAKVCERLKAFADRAMALAKGETPVADAADAQKGEGEAK